MGIRTVEASHPHYFALNLLNNILGGNSMTSRLNLSLREKHGLTYNIESNYTSYSDAGYLYVYFQTSPENISSATKLIQKELKTLSSKKLGYLQLSQAKRQYLGQTAIAWDIHQNRILNMGRQMLSQGRIYDPHDISLIINQITAEQLQEIAIEYLDYAILVH
jgi:predicted Zn-dependent peptidase